MLLKSIFILGLAAAPVLAQAAAWVCPRQRAYERRNALLAAHQARAAKIRQARQVHCNRPMQPAAGVIQAPAPQAGPPTKMTLQAAPAPAPKAAQPAPVFQPQPDSRPSAAPGPVLSRTDDGGGHKIAAGMVAAAALGVIWMAHQAQAAEASGPEGASEDAPRWSADSDPGSAHDRAVQAAILAAARDRAGDRP